MKEQILQEFLEKQKNYDLFCDRIINLIGDLLRQKEMLVHNLSGRVKENQSLARKIEKKIDKYSSINDITDIVGVRIITHLESDVDLVEKLIRDEFKIDEGNSIDKRELNNDQFGYRSLHLVISLNNSRDSLTEYSAYKDLKCEIQIRSILQHAWAEIEHDLGYKGKIEIPDQYKRNFNRLSALLETADKEFDRLKKELSTYEYDVSDMIISEPQNVGIDKASLGKFNLENEILKEARNFLSNKMKWDYVELNNGADEGIISRFSYFKMKTIKDISDSLTANKELFFKFIDVFTDDFFYPEISIDVILYYFQHFLASLSENEDYIEGYLTYDYNINGEPKEFIEKLQKAKKL
ncbi:GTP pyrophosphokinase family protein [Chryseobacterium sp. JUb7]|uniref:GTP pyrophosphokinase n=1 Tax=Chryseobacterium sp. JUb7 TaxID=2940599 RepID=UPI0021678A07|nr:RelA/SpoT domain-containing protein [Chryseobacterium sp. JUb7]MCS3532189.1 ppGpp synthetase/RelA/SpoT-type nucleotidyltransferase [Chryseobacterium sp. JUb7]